MDSAQESIEGNTRSGGNLFSSAGNFFSAAGIDIKKKVMLAALNAFLMGGRQVRGIVFKILENKIAAMMEASEISGIPYVKRVKTQYYIALLRQVKNKIDRGQISREYISNVAKNMVEGLVYKDGSSYPETQFKEKYGFNPPAFVTISPTQRCNLKCLGCYAASSNTTQAALSYETVDKLVNEMHALGSRFIVLSGGEPFIWNDNGKGAIELAEAHPDMFFQAYTNGLLLTDEKIERLIKTANLTPAISVEGYEKHTDARRGKGVFESILKVMNRMKKRGMPFGVSVTASKNNIDILLDDNFYEYWFEEVGATYMWMFHYMPIGRAKDTIDLMISPAERKLMFEKWENLLFNKNYFIGDFWNSGAAADGCIAYARSGGYFHVNWKGNITPCVFVPYWKDNIHDVYAKGGSVVDALMGDLFKRGRQWQKNRGYDNLFAPCTIRDNHADFRREILTPDVKPDDENARAALEDPEYYDKLKEFGDELNKVTLPMWQERIKQ